MENQTPISQLAKAGATKNRKPISHLAKAGATKVTAAILNSQPD